MINFIEAHALGPDYNYSVRNVRAEIDAASDWRTYGFWKDRQPIAAITAIKHQMTLFGERIHGTYLTHALVSPALRGQGLARKLLHETMATMPSRSVQLLTLNLDYAPTVRTFYGGGFESMDSVLSVGFRANAKRAPKDETLNIEKPSAFEREQILDALADFYRGIQLTDFRTSLILKDFWVLKRNGKILAGLQQSTRNYRDVRKHVNFDATFIGNLFFVKGQESSIAPLIGRVFEVNKTDYFYWIGTPTTFSRVYRSLTEFSEFHRDSNPLLVHANLPPEEMANLRRAPLWFGLLNN
jgi:GNAT superfamily N-acetyltransferase